VSSDPGVWIAALATLAIFSFLYKENPAYRFAEHLYVGVAAGNAIVMGWVNVRNLGISPLAKGQFWAIIPIVLGLLVFARFIRRVAWLARYPVAVLVGTGTGLVLRSAPATQVFAQLQATFISLVSINNLIILLGVVGTLAYFVFTKKHTGAFGSLARIGKWAMMVAFGATFGNTTFSYFSLLISSMNMVLGTWLGLVR